MRKQRDGLFQGRNVPVLAGQCGHCDFLGLCPQAFVHPACCSALLWGGGGGRGSSWSAAGGWAQVGEWVALTVGLEDAQLWTGSHG